MFQEQIYSWKQNTVKNEKPFPFTYAAENAENWISALKSPE